VLACEEIAVAENAEFGAAGSGETTIDDAMRAAYRSVAEQRRTIPATVALGMLDPALEVLRVELLDGTIRYVTGDELAPLQQSGTVSNVQTLAGKGDLVRFTGRQMRVQHGFAAHLTSSRQELASELKIAPDALREVGEVDAQWHVVRVNLRGRVHAEQVTRIIRLLQDRLQQGDSCLVLVVIDSPGGSPADSLRLANFLADIDRNQARTCAYVARDARGDAALVALACDDLVLPEEALLGGPGDRYLSPEDLEEMREPIRQLARNKGRDWSLFMALLDAKLPIHRCTREGTGEVRLFSQQERSAQSDPDVWVVGEPLDTSAGLSAGLAGQLGLVRFSSAQVEQVPALYGIQAEPETLEAGWLITRVEHLAAQAWFGRTLLFIAFFALITEASTPGIGVPGFVSATCFLLFFWAQFLNGTAGWLEVMLFTGGLVCVLLEILVLPGFGIFGIGGALMMIASIILASQTFVLPQNAYQFQQMPRSMLTVVMAGFGGFAAIAFLRRYLPHTPWLRHLFLPPPEDERASDLERREALVDFRHLVHKMGMATTQLAPSGKARFGDDLIDVLTDGDVVPAGARVVVVDVRGNRVLVRPVGGVG
jgi:membrane-bound ClpP family serine protease